MQRLHESSFASTLQNVEKPTTGLFGGSFAVWSTGNSIDFKICLREKASTGKKEKRQTGEEEEEEEEVWMAGKERKLSEGDDRCTVARGMEDGGQE